MDARESDVASKTGVFRFSALFYFYTAIRDLSVLRHAQKQKREYMKGRKKVRKAMKNFSLSKKLKIQSKLCNWYVTAFGALIERVMLDKRYKIKNMKDCEGREYEGGKELLNTQLKIVEQRFPAWKIGF